MFRTESKLSEEEKDEIVQEYKNGKPITKIKNDYPISQDTVCNYLEEKGISRNRNNIDERKHNINDDVFKELDDQTCYWIGFLLADGNVRKDGVVRLRLKKSDISHIKKFQKFLNTDYKVYTNKRVSGINIRSEQIVKDLKEYGVIPNKTHKIKIHDDLKLNRHFWRGMIDGDGTVRITNEGYTIISLTGSYNTCISFKCYCYSHTSTQANLVENNYEKDKYSFKTSGSYAEIIISKLYQNARPYLDRKKEVANNIINIM